MVVLSSQTFDSLVRRGDQFRQDGQLDAAIDAYCRAAGATETPPAALCLKLARCYQRSGKSQESARWALAVADAPEDFVSWQGAAALLDRLGPDTALATRRSARLALLGSYTTAQLGPLLRLAGLRFGLALEVFESPYGQYRQEVLDPNSSLYRFAPDLTLLAVHHGDLALPAFSDTPEQAVAEEVKRWAMLWSALAERSGARVVQHNFAIPPEIALGHLDTRLPGSRYAMMQAVNARLGERAGDAVSIVDCERIAAAFGKDRWFDPRYWHLSKQAVALSALPRLARHTAAVLAAELGLTRKCIVLDLDNTLWGGVIGEDRLAGLKLGGNSEGEAFIAFQEYLLELKQRGVILAVCSKNNEADAREPFEQHPDMRLGLDDLAMFVASWEPKPDQVREIARTLNIGLDAIVFLDDNPVEREAMRCLLPEVETLRLPEHPALWPRALADSLLFESRAFTVEDAQRTQQYRARAEITSQEASATSLEDFYRSLRMEALVAPMNETDLARIAQLIGKTNQFNLTTRRHGPAQLRAFMADPACAHFSVRLQDRFTDHGLVSVLIACPKGEALEIDTWLMSCRVIGRTLEAEMLKQLCLRALASGLGSIRGVYVPTAKNGLVADIYQRFGFDLIDRDGDATVWNYDVATKGPIASEFISVREAGD